MSSKRNSPSGEGDDAIIGRALKGSFIVFAVMLFVVGAILAFRYWSTEKPVEVVVEAEPPKMREKSAVELPMLPLEDVTDATGVNFVHFRGDSGEKLLPETMGSGVAWVDYDRDGDQDLFFVNSTDWEWSQSPTPSAAKQCRLFANDGKGNFKDVSEEAGLAIEIYGMGVAVGDYDNDGWPDLFISAVGNNRLMRNEQGKFRDVTNEAGVAGDTAAWSTSCGFLDYDRDGLLDLYVCNYVDWSREKDLSQSFSIDGENRAYGPPRAFGGTFPYLYHNLGGGKFQDVSEEAGVQVRNKTTGVPLGKGMGVVPADVNGDSYLDLIVANDTVQNFLLINQKDGTFVESGELCGIAYDRDGNARGAMGIDAVAFRDDGAMAVGIGNFANEPTALYCSAGPGKAQFNDLAMATGIGPQTRLGLTFGLFFFDVDLDGRLDVLGANGHLEEEINKVQRTQHYAQPPQLFWNAGRAGRSQMIPLTDTETGDDFHQPIVGRGAAFADMDGDGDLDWVITNSGGRARIFRNNQALGNHWLRLELRGKTSNASAIGATVEVITDDARITRTVMPTRSYLSQSELPLTIGLGKANEIQSLTVTWPNGTTQSVDVNGVDQTMTIEEP